MNALPDALNFRRTAKDADTCESGEQEGTFGLLLLHTAIGPFSEDPASHKPLFIVIPHSTYNQLHIRDCSRQVAQRNDKQQRRHPPESI